MDELGTPPAHMAAGPGAGQERAETPMTKEQAEIDKLQAETSNLRLQARWRTEVIKAIGSLLSGITIFVAIAVGANQISQARQERSDRIRRELDQNFQTVVRELASSNAGLRLSAAINLTTFLDNPRYRSRAISIVVSRTALESSAATRVALEDTIVKAGDDALNVLRLQKEAVVNELKPMFTPQPKRPVPRDQIKTRQAGLFSLAAAESRITGKPIDLRGAEFKCFELIQRRLPTAILDDASLWGADLWRAVLKGASLHRADLASADLFGVNFKGADFFGADLFNANIEEADFRGAKRLDVNMFKATNWRLARLDPDFFAALKSTYPNKGFELGEETRENLCSEAGL